MTPCTQCGIAPATRGTLCDGCHDANLDRESPLDIGGRWIPHRGARKWVAA